MRYQSYKHVRKTSGLLGLLALTFFLVLAQSEAKAQGYQIKNYVFGNGGEKIRGAGYVINGTVGQPLIGVVSNSSYKVTSGVCHDTSGIVWTGVLEGFEQVSTLPSAYRLEQNYPNPFNPTTTITFALPRRSQVNMTLYNILGQTVATLVDRQLSAGEYEVTLNGDGLSSGVYFYRIVAGDFVQGKKLVLLK